MKSQQLPLPNYRSVLSKGFIDVQFLNKGGVIAKIPIASVVGKTIPYGVQDTGCISTRHVTFIYDIFAGKINGPNQQVEIIDVDNDYGLVGAYEKEKIMDIFKKITSYPYPNLLSNLEFGFLNKDVSSPEVNQFVASINDPQKNPNPNDAHTIISKGYADKLLSQGYLIDFFGITKDQLSVIRNLYLNCKADQYFFIPITLIPFMRLTSPNYSRHANGLFISKAKGTVYRIEPQYYNNTTDQYKKKIDEKLNNSIKDLVNKIGLKDPTLIPITVKCPQAIVEDKNCIFWSQFIFIEIIRNLYKIKDPNLIIQEISSKPAKELKTMIYNFKKDLFTKWFPEHEKKYNVRIPIIDDNKELFLKQIDDEYVKDLARPINAGGKTKRRRYLRTRKVKRRLH